MTGGGGAGAAPDVSGARLHLDRVAAEPRPAGGEAEQRARAHCAATLRALGFTVEELPFEYSALAGRYGTPLGGLLSIGALALAGHMGAQGLAGRALAALVAAGVVALVAGVWLARHGVTDAPVLRARSVNLEARRGSAEPRAWLVAHLDSKSQPVPIALRALGVTLTGAAWVAALAVACVQLGGGAVSGWWPAVTVLGVLAGLPVAASVVGARSVGALDDASGVATVLLAAAALPSDARVGVLLTSAEELGLAGARAWVATRGTGGGVALNCDGVDDDGRVTCMYTRAVPARLVAALGRAARASGVEVPRTIRLLPGLLTDGVALADRGWEVVTVSRGTLRTLARIHTPRDSRDRLTGRGIAETARVMAGAARELAAGSET